MSVPTPAYKRAIDALQFFTDFYVRLVECGDCGKWDPEKDMAVIGARAVIAEAERLMEDDS